MHFHGQKSSRQDRHRSIYKGSCRKRTMLIRIASPILFFFPDVHLLELEKLWTDKIIVEAHWTEFMQKLLSEWTEFVLYVSPGFLSSKRPDAFLTLSAIVNSDARRKCRISSYPRCYCRSSVPYPCKPMDQTLSSSDHKFHFVDV